MKIRKFIFGTMIVLGVTGFMACSDNDDDDDGKTHNPTEVTDGQGEDLEEQEAVVDGADADLHEGAAGDVAEMSDQKLLQLHQQSAIINIIRTLTGVEEVTIPLGTYEPNFGFVLDESTPFARVIVCETPEQAEADFRSIVGYNDLITPTGDGYTVRLQNVPWGEEGTTVTLGTLTFHRGDGKENMGSIDVNIRCIPTLGSIEYLPSAAMPENGPNDSPYLLGDLVYLPRNNTYCSGYYVCVRQTTSGSGGLLVHLCYGEAKDDETINLDGDSHGCWYPYNNSKGMKTESGHVEAYISFLMEEKTIVDNLKFYLNGKAHDRKPSQSGKLWHILPAGFDNDRGYVYKSTNDKGARIFYDAQYTDKNYYWIFGGTYRRAKYWWVTNNCTSDSWTYVYPTTYDYYKDDTWNDFAKGANLFTMNVITFKKSPISGATIEYSPTTQNLTFENDARFATKTHLGWAYTSSNRLYETVSKARNAGQQPIGILAYVNDGSDFGNKVTEKDEGYGHGLVLGLQNLENQANFRWNSGSEAIAPLDYEFTQYVTSSAAALEDYSGITMTMALQFAGSPAAMAARSYGEGGTEEYNPPVNASRWFLPSAAQWIAMICKPGLGDAPMPDTTGGHPVIIQKGSTSAFTNLSNHLSGSKVYSIGGSFYWSSSAKNESTGIYLRAQDGNIVLKGTVPTQTAKVRPVFAF